jgi:phage-related minor tail protein
MSSTTSGISSALTAIQNAITDFVTGAASVFDGIAQFFVQNATTIGALLAGVGLALFLANRFGLLDALKSLVSAIVPH